MEEDYPRAANLAKEWVRNEKLKDHLQLNIEEVYSMMMNELTTDKNPNINSR